MSRVLASRTTSRYILLTRIFIIIFGCIAVTWALAAFPVFWGQSAIERIASRIIEGAPFKDEILARQIPIIESIEKSAYCRPAAVRSAVIVRLRIVEAMISAGERDKADAEMKVLGSSIRTSLTCSPADPFLWLVLYWADSTEIGFKSNHLRSLQLSYRLGPNEGWVALKRNHIAFVAFDQLTSGLAEHAISEFVTLLESHFLDQAVEIFTGPAWRMRDIILPRLNGIAFRKREAFANALHAQGYNISVPGIEPREMRPWR